jgi:hypothetical protein
MRSRRLCLIAPAALILALSAGCEKERRNVAGAPKAPASPAPAPAPPPTDNFIVGKKTQTILKAQPELEKGAVVGTTKITRKDPITIQGNAYVSMIGQTSILQIQHAMNLYKGANDRYPKDYEEFMAEIIKANNIALPKLPFYQEYGYDDKAYKLIILEYPDKKNGPAPQ